MKNKRFQTTMLQIGKNGLTEAVLLQIKLLFEGKDRVKVTILKSACRDKAEAKLMCDKIVDFLGKNFTYRLVGYVCTISKFKRQVRD